MQQCSTGLSGRAQVANHGSSGAFAANDLIGKKVWTQWPEDNHFYEAVITDYNAVEVHSTLDNLPIIGLLTFSFSTFDRGGMLWFMILIQGMKRGNGSISKR